MAIENKKNDTQRDDLGYIKAHKGNVWIEVKQITSSDDPLKTYTEINSNVPMKADYYRGIERRIIALPPLENCYSILKEILEKAGFEIDSFSAFVYPRYDKDGNPIIY